MPNVSAGYGVLASVSRSRSSAHVPAPAHDTRSTVFFFFSNRLGCAGSLLVSLVLTGVVLVLLFLL